MNFWSGRSYKKCRAREANLLTKWAGIPKEEVEFIDVPITQEKEDFIHTIITGNAENEPLVLLPGFGAAGGMYYKLISLLRPYYRVYAVDLRGMGLSGRPKWPAKSTFEAEQYFMDGLEEWRKKMGIEVPMCLVGHSLGGYISTIYANQFPQHVRHLILMSPVGFPKQPEDFDFDKAINKMKWFPRTMVKMVLPLWSEGRTPLSLIRGFGYAGGLLLRRYMNYVNRFGGIKHKDEVTEVRQFIYHLLNFKPSGEYCIPYILKPGAWAREPLCTRMGNLEMPITFMYGDSDWMSAHSAEHMFADNEQLRGTVHTIPNAGHHLYCDNPDLISEIILSYTALTDSI